MTAGQGRPNAALDTPTLLAFVLGAVLVLQWPAVPAPGRLAALVMLAALAVWQWRLPGRGPVLAFGVGLLLCAWHADRAITRLLPAAWEGHRMVADLRVADLPTRDGAVLRVPVVVEAVGESGPALRGHRLQLHWYGQPEAGVVPGSVWRLHVRLSRPAGPRNPGMGDALALALRQGISARATVDADAPALRIQPPRGWAAWRAGLIITLADADGSAGMRFVRALAVGDVRGLSDADWETLRRSGLTHLIAISGFHVALAALAWVVALRGVFWLCPGVGRVWPRPMALAVAALLGAAAYTALSGFALPTVRTTLMLAVGVLARITRRRVPLGQAVMLAAALMVAIQPLWLLDPGFWLSVVGVGALLWLLAGDDPSPWRQLWRAQWVSSLALLPVLAVFFGEFSVLGTAANLVAVPLFSLVLVPLCLLGLWLQLWGMADAAAWPWQAVATVFEALWPSLEGLAAQPWSLWRLGPIRLLPLLLAGLGVLLLLLPLAARWRLAGALALWPLLASRPEPPPLGGLRLTVWDIPMGQAMMLETASHRWLVDAGRGGSGRDALVPILLRRHGVARLDGVVMAHAGADHAGGWPTVHAAFPDTRAWAPPRSGLAATHPCVVGALWQADGVRLEVLHPDEHFPYLARESSCVLRVVTQHRVVLLPGDIGPLIQRRLIRERAAALRADVLLAPDHGVGVIAPEWLTTVSPRWIIRSDSAQRRSGAGWRQAAAEAGVPLWETSTHGAITLDIAPDGAMQLRTEAGRRWRWWQQG